MPAAPIGVNAPKKHSSTMDTKIVTLDEANAWQIPPFQRPVRINPKVAAMADELKADGVAVSGIITLGRLKDDRAYWLVDGQHRREAFRLSGLEEIIMDLRIVHYDTMAEMAAEFVHLNTALVRMRPDDLLRGIVPSLPNIQSVLDECPYLGFANIRRGGGSGPLVSLSAVLRCWNTSANETPSSSSSGLTISGLAEQIDAEGSEDLIHFLKLAHAAWGRDPEYYKLWGNLNLALCMWLYRRLVLDKDRRGNKRVLVLTDQQFKSCLTALTSSADYLDWLGGKLLNDRDRSPALARVKAVFVRRLTADWGIAKPVLPMPAWASR